MLDDLYMIRKINFCVIMYNFHIAKENYKPLILEKKNEVDPCGGIKLDIFF